MDESEQKRPPQPSVAAISPQDAISKDAAKDQSSDSHSRQQNYRCRPDATPPWKIVIEAALAVAVIAYTIAAWRQLSVMGGQLSQMQRQGAELERVDSAYLSIEDFTVDGFPEAPKGHFTLANRGRSIATNINQGDGGLSGMTSPPDWKKIEADMSNPVDPNVLGWSLPNGEKKPFDFSIESARDVAAGKKYFYHWVIFAYRDLLNHRGRVRGCIYYEPTSRRFKACPLSEAFQKAQQKQDAIEENQ
jgi:hypothetical protein